MWLENFISNNLFFVGVALFMLIGILSALLKSRTRNTHDLEMPILLMPSIDRSLCVGCTVCLRECPTAALAMAEKKAYLLDRTLCVGCSLCSERCPKSAITMVPINNNHKKPRPPEKRAEL